MTVLEVECVRITRRFICYSDETGEKRGYGRPCANAFKLALLSLLLLLLLLLLLPLEALLLLLEALLLAPRGILIPFCPRLGRGDAFLFVPLVEMTVFDVELLFIIRFPRPLCFFRPLPDCFDNAALARVIACLFNLRPASLPLRVAADLIELPAITSSNISAPVVNACFPTSLAKLAAPRFTKGMAVLNNPDNIPPSP